MTKVVHYITLPLSILYWIVFILILLIFHGIQWVSFNFFGYSAHKKSVDLMNGCFLWSLIIVGIRYKVLHKPSFEHSGPTIIVANHQGMFDIPPIIWYLRRLHPKFISKKELGKGIPGISYNLRHSGNVLIDRKNRHESLEKLSKMAEYIRIHNRSVVIFPEGTRSDGPLPGKWRVGGLQLLLNEIPNAVIQPVTIQGTYKIMKYKGLPIPFGSTIQVTFHEVISLKDRVLDDLIHETKAIIEAPLIAANNL